MNTEIKVMNRRIFEYRELYSNRKQNLEWDLNTKQDIE